MDIDRFMLVDGDLQLLFDNFRPDLIKNDNGAVTHVDIVDIVLNWYDKTDLNIDLIIWYSMITRDEPSRQETWSIVGLILGHRPRR